MLPVCMVLSLTSLSYLAIASGGGVLEKGGQWGLRKVQNPKPPNPRPKAPQLETPQPKPPAPSP